MFMLIFLSVPDCLDISIIAVLISMSADSIFSWSVPVNSFFYLEWVTFSYFLICVAVFLMLDIVILCSPVLDFVIFL